MLLSELAFKVLGFKAIHWLHSVPFQNIFFDSEIYILKDTKDQQFDHILLSIFAMENRRKIFNGTHYRSGVYLKMKSLSRFTNNASNNSFSFNL